MKRKLTDPHLRLLKNEEVWDLLINDVQAFKLLTVIAWRAKRKKGISVHGLTVGEALIGDWKACGFSSEKVYRNAKKRLEKYKIITSKGANDGTRAKILHKGLIDINIEEGADEGRTRGDKQEGKEDNIKEINKEKSEKISKSPFSSLPEKRPEDLPSSVKVSALHEKVLHLGEDYGVKLVTKGIRFEKIEATYQHDHVLAVAEALFLWAVDSKNLKEVSTARLKKFLIQDLKYRAEKQQNKWAGVSDRSKVFNTKTNFVDNGFQKAPNATFPNDKNFVEMQRQSSIAEKFFAWKKSEAKDLPESLVSDFKTLTDAAFIESCKKCVARKFGIEVGQVSL